MGFDKDTPQPMKLHGPLCKIFTGRDISGLDAIINTWMESHPNIYLEQQETCVSHGMIVVTLWYTEDSE